MPVVLCIVTDSVGLNMWCGVIPCMIVDRLYINFLMFVLLTHEKVAFYLITLNCMMVNQMSFSFF